MYIEIAIGVASICLIWMAYEIKNAPLIEDISIDDLIREQRQLEFDILFNQSVMTPEEYKDITSKYWFISNQIADLEVVED